MNPKPGMHVAVLRDERIEFGYVSEIVTRQSVDGEKVEVVVQLSGEDVVSGTEEEMVDLGGWNAGVNLHALVMKSEDFKWAYARSSRAKLDRVAPPEPAEPAPVVAEDDMPL